MRVDLQSVNGHEEFVPENWLWTDKSSSVSKQMGCSILYGESRIDQQTKIWLKAAKDLAETNVNSFTHNIVAHEYECYEKLSLLPNISQTLAPISKVDMSSCFFDEFDFAFIVQDLPPLFASNIQDWSIDQIFNRLFLALNALEQWEKDQWIHADLKAAHFRLLKNQAKLIDFGLAHPKSSVRGSIYATPRYMAPELFHAEAKTMQSELYALGVIALEWLNQKKMQQRSYQDWAILHCQQSFLDLPAKFKILEEFILGLISKHKSARFQSVIEAKTTLLKCFV